MSPIIPRNVRLDDTVWAALREVETRDGVPVAEQIRRAVVMWLESKGVKPQAKPTTRKKTRSS